MDFIQVDVFSDKPYQGNPLAVVPEASELSTAQMQAIAREMNLSETTFVTQTNSDSYWVRIFTPEIELPFAGHPTLGTAWALRSLGRLRGNEFTQHSGAGDTRVFSAGEDFWFERPGTVGPDLDERDPDSTRRLGRALGLETSQIGMEARELGRSGFLRPAFANSGVESLMVPLRDATVLSNARPRPHLLEEFGEGMYCFTATQAGRVRARGFFPGAGIAEDPATGSAAASLGLYLADRIGDIDFELSQGEDVGRPSRMQIKAKRDRVQVGGRCALVLRGVLEQLPGLS